MTFYVVIGIIPTLLGIYGNFNTVFNHSRHSLAHCLEGLLPMALCTVFMWSSLAFSNIAWTKPIYFFAPMSFYFSLNCSRVIIATVTKQEYTVFKDFHLTIPIILSTIAIPVNHAYGEVVPEEKLFAGAILLNMFVYFWYITHVI
jgi:hypothetical protein